MAWQYGVSGPFWYASGATIQILLFGILAVEIKRKAPNAHTMLEIVRARWGNTAHKVFFGERAAGTGRKAHLVRICFVPYTLLTHMRLLLSVQSLQSSQTLSCAPCSSSVARP